MLPGRNEGEEHVPIAIVRDFDATPSKLETIKEMIHEDGWTDLG